MARFMLDTDTCIYLIRKKPPEAAERFATCVVGDVVMSAITYAELRYGALVSADPRRESRNLSALTGEIPVVPFDALAAATYGPIRLATRERRADHLDKLIAAHALSLDLILVSNNLRHFRAYPGLKLENWLAKT